MTAYRKIAISLPLEVCEHVRRSVERGEASSVSAYIATAIEAKAKQDSLAALLDELLDETGGPMTPAERRWADRTLGAGRSKPRRTRRP